MTVGDKLGDNTDSWDQRQGSLRRNSAIYSRGGQQTSRGVLPWLKDREQENSLGSVMASVSTGWVSGGYRTFRNTCTQVWNSEGIES